MFNNYLTLLILKVKVMKVKKASPSTKKDVGSKLLTTQVRRMDRYKPRMGWNREQQRSQCG